MQNASLGFGLQRFMPYVLPAALGFAASRLTSGHGARSGGGGGLFGQVVPVAATLGGYYGGSRVGSYVGAGQLGVSLDSSALGAWYAGSALSQFTGGRASGALSPLGGVMGALLGSMLTR